jgi:putative copper export protein/methionine-rich copper-binding protein CopC
MSSTRRWLRIALVGGLVAVGLAITLQLAAPHRVQAHARLTSVQPAPNSTVPGPLKQVVVQYNEPVDKDLFRAEVDAKEGSAMSGKPVFVDPRTVALPLRSGVSGALVVTWLAVGLDAHPVQGQFLVGVSAPGGAATLAKDLSAAATHLGDFEGGAGSGGLLAAIEAGRALEIGLLYLTLGIVALGLLTFGWPRRRARAGAGAVPSTRMASVGAMSIVVPAVHRGYRALLATSVASALLMPILFTLYASRLTQVISGIGFGRVISSSIGVQWTIKLVLWAALAGTVTVAIRHMAQGRQLDGRLVIAPVVLALGLAGAFVSGTHVGTGSADPSWLYIPVMAGHILLTAFWAGGLFALLVLVFPMGDPAYVWAVISRFSRIMTVTAGIMVASGVVILVKLLANFNALWCTGYGLVAGFKVLTVILALSVGLVNNRLVAAHRNYEALPAVTRQRLRRGGPSLVLMQRVILCEAAMLLGVLVLAAVLGESQLPPLLRNVYLPGEGQDAGYVTSSGLFGSGCVR